MTDSEPEETDADPDDTDKDDDPTWDPNHAHTTKTSTTAIDDDDDSDGLVSSPSAKRRKLRRTNSLHAEDLEGEGFLPNVKSSVSSLNYLPPISFLKNSTSDQICFEVLFAYMCLNALTVKPDISLQRRKSCQIL